MLEINTIKKRNASFAGEMPNYLQNIREFFMRSKIDISRRSGLGIATIDRIENGASVRTTSKRKIIEALIKLLQETYPCTDTDHELFTIQGLAAHIFPRKESIPKQQLQQFSSRELPAFNQHPQERL